MVPLNGRYEIGIFKTEFTRSQSRFCALVHSSTSRKIQPTTLLFLKVLALAFGSWRISGEETFLPLFPTTKAHCRSRTLNSNMSDYLHKDPEAPKLVSDERYEDQADDILACLHSLSLLILSGALLLSLSNTISLLLPYLLQKNVRRTIPTP